MDRPSDCPDYVEDSYLSQIQCVDTESVEQCIVGFKDFREPARLTARTDLHENFKMGIIKEGLFWELRNRIMVC